jgi:hypothetical protein
VIPIARPAVTIARVVAPHIPDPSSDDDPIGVRLSIAEDGLALAESADLGAADNAELVELVETLRGDLTDMIRVIRELRTPDQDL